MMRRISRRRRTIFVGNLNRHSSRRSRAKTEDAKTQRFDTDGTNAAMRDGFQTAKNAKYTNQISGCISAFSLQNSLSRRSRAKTEALLRCRLPARPYMVQIAELKPARLPLRLLLWHFKPRQKFREQFGP